MSDVAVEIRPQGPGELGAVLDVVRAAFGEEGEILAPLVVDLQGNDAYAGGSWLAWDGPDVVGHVMLTRGWIDAERALVTCPVLSPLSVVPGRQGEGVGGALLRHAVAAAEAEGAPGVILEGDPGYYVRHGFEPAEPWGILRPSAGIPAGAFQWVRLPNWQPWMVGRFVYPDRFYVHDAVGLRDWRKQRHTGLATLTTVTLGARDLPRLARFYADLLAWGEPEGDPSWVAVRDPEGGVGIAIQHEPDQAPPVWPAGPGDQHKQAHLEIRVADLAEAVAHAQALGARLAEHQAQEDVRVMLDPEGHPFCLWLPSD